MPGNAEWGEMTPTNGRNACPAFATRLSRTRRRIGALLASAPLAAQERGPLSLASASHFFVGGRIDRFGRRQSHSRTDVRRVHDPGAAPPPLSIVMVHGGSQTSTNAPARRTAAKAGRSISCAAAPRRLRGRPGGARALRALVAGARSGAALAAPFVEQRRFVAPERFKQWPQAHLHTQWPGTGKPGDPAFDQFTASQFPSIVSFPKQQELNRDALVALLDKIGLAILLSHSQSGASTGRSRMRPSLVKALVAVEPSGPPVHDIENTGAPDWFKDAERTKVGAGRRSAHHDPPLGAGGARIRPPRHGGQTRARALLAAEGTGPPVAASQEYPGRDHRREASYHAAYDHCTAAYLTQAGVRNALIRLADVGVRGNGHMMIGEEQCRHRRRDRPMARPPTATRAPSQKMSGRARRPVRRPMPADAPGRKG